MSPALLPTGYPAPLMFLNAQSNVKVYFACDVVQFLVVSISACDIMSLLVLSVTCL